MGRTTTAVPQPKISFKFPDECAFTISLTESGLISTFMPLFLAISIRLFLVMPSRILSLVGGVIKVSSILKKDSLYLPLQYIRGLKSQSKLFVENPDLWQA